MEIRKNINKIGENKKTEDMQKMGDMLADLIYMTKDSHPEIFEKYSIEIYEMANGKVLTEKMAKEWVSEMNPPAKWSMEQTSAVKRQYGISSISDIDFYVVMNMMYSDMSGVLGSGDDSESLNAYVNATKAWLLDEDASPDKLYNYWKYVIN